MRHDDDDDKVQVENGQLFDRARQTTKTHIHVDLCAWVSALFAIYKSFTHKRINLLLSCYFIAIGNIRGI